MMGTRPLAGAEGGRERGREGRGGPDFSGELGKVKWDRLSRRRSRMAPEGEGGGKGGERRHPLCSALSILLQTAEWEEEKSTNREILFPKTVLGSLHLISE